MASQINAYQPIKSLPYELLTEIARQIPERHEFHGYVVEVRSLAAFSACSRTLRAIGQELLFQEVLITSENQLQALMRVPSRLLQQIKQLNIFMDIEFYDGWSQWAFISPLQRKELAWRYPPPISPYAALAAVLSHTSHLETLRVTVAESTGPRSPWHKFSTLRAIGIPFGTGLAHGLSLASSHSMHVSLDGVRLPKLTKLQLAGFEDVESLLELAPNLEYLTMELAGGYSQTATVDLLESLPVVPKLRHLAYSPEGLYVDGLDSAVIDQHDIPRPVNMIAVIGKTLPQLEVLDLRSYWHGDKISYLQSLEYLVPEHLLRSFATLPKVHTLTLPTTVVTEPQLISLRLPFHSLRQPDLSRMLLRRQTAIVDIDKAEAELIDQAGEAMPALRSLSFVRPLSPTDFADSCITYKLEATTITSTNIPAHTHASNITSSPSSSSSTPSPSPKTHFSVRSEFIQPAFLSPVAISPWPYTSPLTLAYTLKAIYAQTSPQIRRHLALSYVHDHEMLALVAAGAGGAVIGHVMHLFGEKFIVAGLFAGSAVYAASRVVFRERWGYSRM